MPDHEPEENNMISVGAKRLGKALAKQNPLSPNRLARYLNDQGETGGRQGIRKNERSFPTCPAPTDITWLNSQVLLFHPGSNGRSGLDR